jgi:hypothetical protein
MTRQVIGRFGVGGVLAALALSTALQAQDFKLFNRTVQVHGFATEGYLHSSSNNYLTMPTSGSGSFAMTDFGVNASTELGDKVHVGAQFYDRNIGALGNWHPTLDWAVIDYKYKSWLEFRGGQAKTTLGLFNDTQDLEFIYTWALLPQAVYPVDLRGENIAHIGGDVLGRVRVKKLGSVAYTAYGGKQPSDMQGGFVYGINSPPTVPVVKGHTTHLASYGGTSFGGDLRWQTPVKGLLVGSSFIAKDLTTTGTNYYWNTQLAVVPSPYAKYTKADHTTGFYSEYTFRNFRFDGEYRRQQRETSTIQSKFSCVAKTGVCTYASPSSSASSYDYRYGYVAASYRFTKWFEAGAYNSRYIAAAGTNWDLPTNHIYDQTIAAKFDIDRFVDLKVEGHFIDGNGGAKVDRGFYPDDNAKGYANVTDLLVVRTGFHF